MKTNIVLSLDTRRAKKDGSYPVMLRLGHHARTTSIPTGVSLKEKDWNAKDRKVKSSYTGVSSVTRLNNMLQKQKADAMDIILKLQETGQLQTLSLTELREKIAHKENTQSFFEFAENLAAELTKAGRFGTARSYKGLIKVLKTHHGNNLPFQYITYDFLTKFETRHIGKGYSYNGLSVYLRAIRAIYNKAIMAGAAEKEHYPFEKYKIKTIPTKKRALEWESIKKIITLDIDADHPCFDTRNYFLASYMMYGMNFSDMAYLRKSDIAEGRITYRRRKTNKLYDIKITPELDKILSYYINLHPEREFIFPIIQDGNSASQYADVYRALKHFNVKLKELGKLCDIQQEISSYVIRHSFSNKAMQLNVPLNAISAMLGHSSLKTTEIYLKSLPSNILDDYNEKVMGDAEDK